MWQKVGHVHSKKQHNNNNKKQQQLLIQINNINWPTTTLKHWFRIIITRQMRTTEKLNLVGITLYKQQQQPPPLPKTTTTTKCHKNNINKLGGGIGERNN